VNWTTIACEISVVVVELGVLFAYRVGWSVGKLAMTANTTMFLILVPIGVFIFREKVGIALVAGGALCIAGLRLLLH
jgi:hypothetical protein